MSATMAIIVSSAVDVVGIPGAGCSSVYWSNVTVFVNASNLSLATGANVGVIGTGSGGVLATWLSVAVVIVDSVVVCQQSVAVGILGTGVALQSLGNRAAVVWRNVTAIAAGVNMTVRADGRAAVLGFSADDCEWDSVFVGAIEASSLFLRFGTIGYVLGAPGGAGGGTTTVLANESSRLDVTDSAVLCSNRTCHDGYVLPSRASAWVEGARQTQTCGWMMMSEQQRQTETTMTTTMSTTVPPSDTAGTTETSTASMVESATMTQPTSAILPVSETHCRHCLLFSQLTDAADVFRHDDDV